MKLFKALLLVLVILFLIIQFLPTGMPDNKLENEKSIALSGIADDSILVILKTSCYDCHSDQTDMPWYSKIKPVSWLLANHIKEGREHLNFSIWDDYSTREKLGLLNDIVEETGSGEMPLKSYLLMHRDAKLDEAAVSALEKWGEEASDALLE